MTHNVKITLPPERVFDAAMAMGFRRDPAIKRSVLDMKKLATLVTSVHTEWCRENVKGQWSATPDYFSMDTDSRGGSYRADWCRWTFVFERAEDATLFKLFHA